MLLVPGGGSRYRGVLQGGGGVQPTAILANRFQRSKIGNGWVQRVEANAQRGAELIPFLFLSLAHGSLVGSVQRVEAHAPQGAELIAPGLARSKSSRGPGQLKNCFPKNMKQGPGRIREASPQSGLGEGCKRCSRSRKLRGLSLHAQARRTSISLLLTLPRVLPKEAGKPLGGGSGRATHPQCRSARDR